MGKDYFIGEGNKIGYLPTEFGSNLALSEKTLKAGADLVKGQVVILSDALTVVPSTAPSKFVLGVAMFDAKINEPVSIETEGLFKLTASAAITAPAEIEASTAGKVVTAGGTPVKVIGIALTDASTDGDVYVKFSI
jgi:predicted RecA/RadA family phage recombinase